MLILIAGNRINSLPLDVQNCTYISQLLKVQCVVTVTEIFLINSLIPFPGIRIIEELYIEIDMI